MNFYLAKRSILLITLMHILVDGFHYRLPWFSQTLQNIEEKEWKILENTKRRSKCIKLDKDCSSGLPCCNDRLCWCFPYGCYCVLEAPLPLESEQFDGQIEWVEFEEKKEENKTESA